MKTMDPADPDKSSGSRPASRSTLRFESLSEVVPEQSEGVYNSMEGFRDTIDAAASKNAAVIEEVMTKALGQDAAKTFLTGLDIASSRATSRSTLARPESETRMRSLSNATVKSNASLRSLRSRATAEPPKTVEGQLVPGDLADRLCPLPSCDVDALVEIAAATVRFESEEAGRAYGRAVQSAESKDVMADCFWYSVLHFFQDGEEEVPVAPTKAEEERKGSVYERMSCSFVRLFLSVASKHKDNIFDNYYDTLAQTTVYALCKEYPGSVARFEKQEFKCQILQLTALWTVGCVPSTLSHKHWTLHQVTGRGGPKLAASAFKSAEQILNPQKELFAPPKQEVADEDPEPLIPTAVKRETVYLVHAQFVQTYLKVRGVAEIGNKNICKVHVTSRNIDAPPKDDKQKLFGEMSQARQADTEASRASLSDIREGFKRFYAEEREECEETRQRLRLELHESEKRRHEVANKIVADILARADDPALAEY